MSIVRPWRRRAAARVAGLAVAVAAVLVTAAGSGAAAPGGGKPKPTVVLVHGAFADSSRWIGVVARLRRDGYPVVAAADHLRGLTYLQLAVSDET
jgi:pimeloyl-ACP methyl ester carboxylesterase